LGRERVRGSRCESSLALGALAGRWGQRNREPALVSLDTAGSRMRHCVAYVLAASLAALAAAAVYWVASLFFLDGESPYPEAIPVWAHPDLSLMNRMADYGFGLTFGHKLKEMSRCPAWGPDFSCVAKLQKYMANLFDMGWAGALRKTHKESVVWVQRDGGRDDPMEVVLLQPADVSVGMARPPLILWLHGGGFVVGSARDPMLLSLLDWDLSVAKANGTSPLLQQAVWASVQYRLTPQHPHPAAFDDAYRALEYLVREHGGPKGAGYGSVHVAGNSAGAVLAAGTALRALQNGIQVDTMMIDVPCFPTRARVEGTSIFDSPAWRRNYHTKLPGTAWSNWFWAAWTRCHENCTQAGPGACPVTCGDSSWFAGGALSWDHWRKAASKGEDLGGNGLLPALVVNTARGDIFYDGGKRFFDIYYRAAMGAERIAPTYRIDSSANHGGTYHFDPAGSREIVSKWGTLVRESQRTRL